MQLGLGLPQLGHFATPEALRAVAVEAERAGYASLWAIDRLLVPLEPRSAYPARADGMIPPEQHVALDPLLALATAAAVTERIRIGTNVLVAPWYPPVVLGRSLASLDVLSGGRLDIGLGQGWSIDEYDAAGVPMAGRGDRLDEILDVWTSLWGDEQRRLETSGELVVPAKATVRPRQLPSPPVLLAGFTPAGLDRVARRADGWLPTGVPTEALGHMWADVRRRAADYGRDPDALRLVVRVEPKVAQGAAAAARAPFTGSVEAIRDDLARLVDIGATEAIIDLQSSAREIDELLDLACELNEPIDHAA